MWNPRQALRIEGPVAPTVFLIAAGFYAPAIVGFIIAMGVLHWLVEIAFGSGPYDQRTLHDRIAGKIETAVPVAAVIFALGVAVLQTAVFAYWAGYLLFGK